MTRRKIIIGAVALVVVATGATIAQKHFAPPPAGTDFSRTRTTAKGLFIVSIAPEKEPFVRSALHSWIVTIKTAAGADVSGAKLLIDGGMPQHGHGLPTEPKMTAELGNGRYRVEGVRFNMGGWWEFKVAVKAAVGDDAVTINLSF